MGSTNSLNDSYIIPCRGPKIKIIQPSVKSKVDQVDCRASFESNISRDLPLRGGNPERTSSDQSIKYKGLSDSSRHSAQEVNRDREQCVVSCTDVTEIEKSLLEDNKEKSLWKLSMEGPSYIEKNSSFTISASSQYEKLRNSKYENSVYKSLNKPALILPRRPRICSPFTPPRSIVKMSDKSQPDSSTNSKQLSGISSRYSDHTYESINSILACEINRRDSVASDEQNDINGAHNVKETHKKGSNPEEQNDLSGTFPSHSYESIKSKAKSELEKSEIACENSAVIIGRRVSNPFDSNKFSKRMINKKKQKSAKNNVNQTEKKVQKDSEERYSPFPGTKKLAFKSAFKQVPVSSPRFSMIQTVTGNMNSQVVYKPEMCPDSLNIKTPEIKVENCAQFFNNTAFISPQVLNANTFFAENGNQNDTIDFVSPVPTYLSLKDCVSLKVSDANLQTSLTEKCLSYRKSLPSLSDHLEEDILKHCNTNVYSKSTPCELDQPCQFF